MDAVLAKPLVTLPTGPPGDLVKELAANPGPPGAEEERSLVAALKRGEHPAMRTLYERYVRRVHTLVARIAGQAEADEITQDVFVKALRGIGAFRGECQLGTWMYRLAVNAALSHVSRDQARRRRHAGEEALLLVPAEQAEGDPILSARLQRAMAELPAGYRAVLVLHDIEGLQHDEIAAILGVRVGTSKSQLHKARARMRELLEAP
jgi:RNA polymerase sigma-70 factor (ECF subfamily)